MQHTTLNWIYVLLWAGLLFVLSSIPDLPGPSFFSHSDKIGHVGLYLPLGFLLRRAMAANPSSWRGAAFAWPFLIGTAYGITDEIHQYFVPGRTMDAADLLADMIGVALGIALYYAYKTRRMQTHRDTQAG